MARRVPDQVEKVLNSFAEVMGGLMIEKYQQDVAALDLTLPQAQMLRILRRGRLPTGLLAVELRISASSVTQLTDRMIRKGLIERQAVEGDRRSVLVALSPKGKRLVDQFRKSRGILFRQALSRLSEPEQAQVIEAMQLIGKALESYELETVAGDAS